MRILQVCPDFPPWAGSGAAETFRLLSQSWYQHGHEVTVVCSLPNSRARAAPLVAPYRIESYRLFDVPSGLHEASYYAPMLPDDRRRFLDFVRQESTTYDIVIVHGFLETAPRFFMLHYPRRSFDRLLSLQYSISTADYNRGLRIGSWLLHMSLGTLMISRTKNIVVFSSGARSELREYFGPVSERKVHELGLGIDAAAFASEWASANREPPAVAQWLESRSIRPPFIFAIGRNNRAKGFDLLVESFCQLATEFPSLMLVLAGERTPFTADLERMIRERNLVGRVRVLGRVSSWERMALLTTSTVFAIPSRKEGYGLNAVHARILSKPTVATSTGAHREILDGNGPYRLVAPGDVSQLTVALRAALRDAPATVALDPAQLARFDIDVLAESLLNLVPADPRTPH